MAVLSGSGGGTITSTEGSDPGNFSVETSSDGQVPCVAFDEVIENVGEIDLLKMDCEGAEYDILMNLPDASLAKIKRIALEYHNEVTRHSHCDLVKFLESRGFTVLIHRNPVHAFIGFLYAHLGSID